MQAAGASTAAGTAAARAAGALRRVGVRRLLALALVPLLIAIQLQRGAAEAHHNHDAPLTIEAPWEVLPCDLALWAYPAVLADPLAASLNRLRLAAHAAQWVRLTDLPVRDASGPNAPDVPRAPPSPAPATS